VLDARRRARQVKAKAAEREARREAAEIGAEVDDDRHPYEIALAAVYGLARLARAAPGDAELQERVVRACKAVIDTRSYAEWTTREGQAFVAEHVGELAELATAAMNAGADHAQLDNWQREACLAGMRAHLRGEPPPPPLERPVPVASSARPGPAGSGVDAGTGEASLSRGASQSLDSDSDIVDAEIVEDEDGVHGEACECAACVERDEAEIRRLERELRELEAAQRPWTVETARPFLGRR
jgi:hypothetical protein